METYQQHIEIINNYINNLLSAKARINFEARLQSDQDLNTLYQEHVLFLKGLERIPLKADIVKAQRAYLTEKWLKISGIAIIGLGVLVVLYTFVFQTSEIDPTPKHKHANTVVTDTVSVKTETETIQESSSEFVVKDTTLIDKEQPLNTTTESNTSGGNKAQISLKKRPERIRINTQKDTVVRCKEGTLLRISKGSFRNPITGLTVQGEITLVVSEFYQLSDILLNHLSTVSDGNQLETGGMLQLKAYQQDTSLELNSNETIEIAFPTASKKPDMQLFTGEWNDDNINWKLENDQLESIEVSVEAPTESENIEVPFSVVEQAPTFPGCENEDEAVRKQCTIDAIANFIDRNFNKDIANILGLSGTQRIMSVFKIDRDGQVVFIQSRASDPRLSDEADRVIALLPQMVPGLQRGKPVTVPYSLPIVFNVNNRVQNVSGNIIMRDSSQSQSNFGSTVAMDTIFNERRGMVELIREVMHDKDFIVDSLFLLEWDQYKQQRLIRNISLETQPNRIETAYVLRKALFEMPNTKFKILEDDSITRGGHVIRVPWDKTKIPTTTRIMNLVPKRLFYAGNDAVTTEEFESRLIDNNDRSITSRDANYYVLKTSNLGWINCDRFINGRTKRIKYKIKIKNAEGAQISMIFKSVNSVLPSWKTNGYYDFQTVPDNQDIILFAIKRKAGKLYYDLVPTKTEEHPDVNFDFKEVSLEALKITLDQLNSDKN
ncbi:MAG: hypothetical protein GYB32_01240 [Algicola sp.]|nr:hypothetical protein [Algicola sp.]